MSHAFHLDPLDAAILLGYVLALASIGAWAARKAKGSTDDYFLAGRSIPWMVTTASFLATCISALTFIGTPAEGYGADFRYFFANAGDVTATFIVAFLFLPVYQRMNVTSIYQVVAQRFGPSVRTACSGLFILSRMLGATVRIVAIATVVEVVSGGALSYFNCVLLVIVAILAYTTLGGGRAIAWTDLLQFVLLLSGALLALAFLVTHVPGGFGGILDAGRHAVNSSGHVYNKFNFLEMLKPENLWIFALMVVWAVFNSSAAYGCDQDMAQRLLSCNDPKKARWSLTLAGLIGIPNTLLFLTIGAGLYAFSLHHSLLAPGESVDHVFPNFILTVLPPGIRGLLLAAVASAAMGSSDSALASLATAFTIDFYKPFWGKNATEAQALKVSKLSYFVFGLCFLFLAPLVRNFDQLLWLGFKLVAFTYPALLGVFLVANLTKWKVKPKVMLSLMLGITGATVALGITAYLRHAAGDGGTWALLDTQLWRLYVPVGSLLIVAGAFLMRERGEFQTEAPQYSLAGQGGA